MKLIRQVIYDIRQQPMVSWISVGGTALTIFLVMVIYMLNGVNSTIAEPELNRDRVFYGTGVHVKTEKGGDNSSSFSLEFGKKIYNDLEGVEKIAYTTSYLDMKDAQIGNSEAVEVAMLKTDNEFWNLYDFHFSEGRPYDKEDYESGVKKAVITKSLQEKLVGKGESAIGKELLLDFLPYTVVGVIDNNNPLLSQTYADVYVPYIPSAPWDVNQPWFGDLKVHLLAKPGVSVQDLRKKVEARYKGVAAEMKKDGYDLQYHSQPYTAEIMAKGDFGTNTTPDLDDSNSKSWLIYTVLLLLPAINLSTMTRSRMRRRVSEIGVRRAFGAKRFQIIGQLLAENLALTIVGGLIGLILSLIFAVNFSQYVVTFVSEWGSSFDQITASPQFSMLFKWHTFLFALLFCVILNIVSAGIPSWRASRVNPAEALSSRGR